MIKKLTLLTILLFSIATTYTAAQVFENIQAINPISTETNTGEKPQSKVWKNQGEWWCVLHNSNGTHIFRLDEDPRRWTQVYTLSSSSTSYKADCKVDGDTTHILLYRNNTSTRLASVQYQSSDTTYVNWSGRPDGNEGVPLGSGVETATIDIDSDNRMWVAYESSGNIVVRNCVKPYEEDDWSSPYTLYSGVDGDDICAITAFGGDKIGVLWSNQVTEEFQFRYRNDSEPNLESWMTLEIAESDTTGGGIADDHINFAVHSSTGTIYAAVKTSYDNPLPITYPIIGLLKRNSSGSWDNMYTVETDKDATRPIVLLNETSNILYVIYTESGGGGPVYLRESPTNSINFGPSTILKSGNYDNTTSIKNSYTDDIVILYSTVGSDPITVEGFYSSDGALPVELASFTGKIINGKVNLIWRTETEVDNYGFEIQRSAGGILSSEEWEIIGFIEGHGNSNSPKNYSFQDNPFPRTGSLYYRLKQIDTDGQFEYSESIEVKFDALEQFVLYQNYPNPFNPTTKISWYSPYSTHQSIKLFDILGNEVAVLFDEFREAGNYEIEFNAEGLSSGVYFYQLKAGDFIQSKKMIISK